MSHAPRPTKPSPEACPACIRPARPDDVPQLVTLIRELADYEKLAHACHATPDALREHLFPSAGGTPLVFALVAELDQRPVGFALFFYNYSTFLTRPGIHLEDIYVQPAFRGKGIGKALLLQVVRLAVDRGCGRVEWSVLDWNTPAIGFYRSLGAVPMEEWTTFRLTGDALIRLAAKP